MGESGGGWGRVGAGKKRESSEELVLAGFVLVDCTRMFLWAYGCMVIWVYVFMVVWLYGYMGVCFYGRMVVWLYGCMFLWAYGCMVIWVYLQQRLRQRLSS